MNRPDHRSAARAALALLGLTVAACGKDDPVTIGTGEMLVVSMSPATLSLSVGESGRFVVQITGGSSSTLARCASSDVTVASAAASDNGCAVVGLRPGVATITAVASTGATAAAALTVTEPTIARLTLAPGSDTLRVGTQRTLTVALQDAAGRAITGRTGLRFTSSNAAVATVDSSGRVSALAPGAVTISAAIPATTGGSALVTGTASLIVVSPVRALTATASATSLRPSQTATLTAAITVDAGVTNAIVWRSANPAVATVTSTSANTATLTAVAPGTVSIIALAQADTTARVVVPITVATGIRSIALSPRLDSLRPGATRSITAAVSADSGVSTTVTYVSRTPAVATVSATGVVQALAPGRAIIVGTPVADSRIADSVSIVVLPPRVQGVTIVPAATTVLVGRSISLGANVTADLGLATGVRWLSSNPGIATVSSAGAVVGIAPGVARITAVSVADTTVSGTATVTVQTGIRSLSLTPKTDSLFPNQSRTLAASLVADAGVSQAITWTSRTTSVATVSDAGVVQALAPGRAVIVARATADASITDSAVLTVADPCVYRIQHTAGTSITGTISNNGCLNSSGKYGWFGRYTIPANATQILSIATATVAQGDVTPVVVANGAWTFRNITSTNSCILAPAGDWDFGLFSSTSGSWSLTSTLTTAPDNCSSVMAVTGTRGVFTVNQNSRAFTLAGFVGTRPGVPLNLVPTFRGGDSLTISAVATGFEPIVEFLDENSTVLRSAGVVGQTTTTLSYTVPSSAAGPVYLRARVVARDAAANGTVTITVSGPSAVRSGVRAGMLRNP